MITLGFEDWMKLAAIALGIPSILLSVGHYLLSRRERNQLYRERVFDRQLLAYGAIAEAASHARRAIIYSPESSLGEASKYPPYKEWVAEWRSRIQPTLQELDQTAAFHALFVSREVAAAVEQMRREGMNLVFTLQMSDNIPLDQLTAMLTHIGAIHDHAIKLMRHDLSLDAIHDEARRLLGTGHSRRTSPVAGSLKSPHAPTP